MNEDLLFPLFDRCKNVEDYYTSFYVSRNDKLVNYLIDKGLKPSYDTFDIIKICQYGIIVDGIDRNVLFNKKMNELLGVFNYNLYDINIYLNEHSYKLTYSYLLSKDYNFNFVDKNGDNLFFRSLKHCTFSNSYYEFVKWLIQKIPHLITNKNSKGVNILDLIQDYIYINLLKKLEKYIDMNLYFSSNDKKFIQKHLFDCQILKYIAKKYPNELEPDSNKETLFHMLIDNKHTYDNIVNPLKILVKIIPDQINLTNNKGDTLLLSILKDENMTHTKKTRAMKILLENNADMYITDANGDDVFNICPTKFKNVFSI